mmetsp:Transcript_12177/g.18297  ORF Transcript_12177/g.18297 Transcript_12177/m.18297 type:complete len:89 (+) Transcript_12177:897-1163(+)
MNFDFRRQNFKNIQKHTNMVALVTQQSHRRWNAVTPNVEELISKQFSDRLNGLYSLEAQQVNCIDPRAAARTTHPYNAPHEVVPSFAR